MIFSLGRHLIESTLFVVIVAVVALFLRRSSAATRHAMWLAATAKFILPAAAFSSLGASLAQFLPASAASASFPTFFIHPTIARTSFSSWIAARSGVSGVLIAFWLIGIAVAFSMWLPKLRASLRHSRRAENAEQPLLIRLRRRMGLRREVRLRFSDSISEPALLGFWKPVIALPSGLAENLSSVELESILLHELAHAKRWDNWAAVFTHAVTCVFWFYPLLWWIENRMHSERELACDELVIGCGSKPQDYVAGILKVCRFRLGAEVAGISGVCGSNLKRRMEVIMSLSSNARLLQSPRILFGSVSAIAILFPLTVGFLTAPNSFGQAAKGRSNQTGPENQISCSLSSVLHPEGTVVQVGKGPEQMCVRVLRPEDPKNPHPSLAFRSEWVRTNESIRERAATVIHVAAAPKPAMVSCKPEQSAQQNLCVCAGGENFSLGALVKSAIGPFQLHCERGTWVQTATPNLVRK